MSKRRNEEQQDQQLFLTEEQKEVEALLIRLRHAIEKSVSCKDKEVKEEWRLLIAELTEQVISKTGKTEYVTITSPLYPFTYGDYPPFIIEPTITCSDNLIYTADYVIDFKQSE